MSKQTLILVTVLVFVIPSAARALDIVFTDVGSTPMSVAQLEGFERAAQSWEAQLFDPITVQLNIAFEFIPNPSPNTTILGQTWGNLTTHPYGTVRNALIADAPGPNSDVTEFEKGIYEQLPTGSLPIQDAVGIRNVSSITMTFANAKALGLGALSDSVYSKINVLGTDGTVTFNTQLDSSFDYDDSDGIDVGKTDFVEVSKHEIGHALGFSSMTDLQDLNSAVAGNPYFQLKPQTLDLWRFAETGGFHNLGTETRLVTAGPAEFFISITDTPFENPFLDNIPFSHGIHDITDPNCPSNNFGNACQASHWQNNQNHLMDPYYETPLQFIEPQDITAMKFIGYDRAPRQFVPPDGALLGMYKAVAGPNPIPPPPDFGGLFAEFPAYPSNPIAPPFTPDAAVEFGLDLGTLGRRTFLGAIQFANQQSITPSTLVGSDNADLANLQQNLAPAGSGPAASTIPAAITAFYAESETVAGEQWFLTGLMGENGFLHDTELGSFGGWSIVAAIDGRGGGDARFDIDGILLLTMEYPNQIFPDPTATFPDPTGLPTLRMSSAGPSTRYQIRIYDPVALGIPEPSSIVLSIFGLVTLVSWTGWRQDRRQAPSNGTRSLRPHGGKSGNRPARRVPYQSNRRRTL